MSERITVLTTGPLMPYLEERLNASFDVVGLHLQDDPVAFLAAQAARVRAIATSTKYGVSEATLARLPALEIISSFGVGMDSLPLAAAEVRGIVVVNTPDVLNDDTSNMALALALAITRNLVTNDRYVREGRWSTAAAVPLGSSLAGKVVGIVGMGRIGFMAAQKFEAFGCKIAYHNRSQRSEVLYDYYTSVEELARASDILVATLPGGNRTHHLIDADVFAALGSGGWFINVARGSVVDEVALVAALRDGTIKGAGLDVFEHEPEVPEALLSMDNVVLQPHQASATKETRRRMADCVVNNLLKHFA